MSTIAAKMVGGPVGRQTGEVVTKGGQPPERLFFGASGGFVYVLDKHATPRKVGGKPTCVYRYNREETAAKLKHLGVPLTLVADAVDDTAMGIMAMAGLIERPEIAGYEVRVTVERYADRWDALIEGEVVDTLPRDEISDDDTEALEQWVQQVGEQYANEVRERREAAGG